jgi:hypothetical protein
MEPLAFYGVWAASLITGIHKNALERRLGDRDGTMRFRTKDAPLWYCERILAYATSRKLHPGPDKPGPTFYTISEGARFVGITERVLRRLLPKEAPAVLAPARPGEPSPLYPLRWLHSVRQKIASGEIPLQARSLRKPRMGARLCSPRHVLAESQSCETESLRKAYPMDYVIW